MFVVTLRSGMSKDATVLYEIGAVDIYEEAETLAQEFIDNPANKCLLGCKSYYVRGILESETTPRCTCLDYGSHSKFIYIIEEQDPHEDKK